jgi:hypothetical protein
MNTAALGFFIVSAGAVLCLPRKWAPVPLLVACCYMTIGQGVDIGPFSLPIYRMVIATGLLRVVLRGERFAGRLNTIDRLLLAWTGWVMFASLFHEWEPGSGPVFASGYVFNITLVYFLIRVWCHDLNELTDLIRIVAVLLVPVALEMMFEHLYGRNLFSVFGGVEEAVYIRDGVYRAQGPFNHPILAGTVGAVSFPLMVGIWRRHRVASLVGSGVCLAMIVASASSGPLISLAFGILGLLMWYRRDWLRAARFACVGAYLMLELLMSRPAYYVISKIDLTGSSTGWHRSRLIEAALEHFSEWWLFGTDRTVHWMGISVGWSEKHADITNYYISFAVIGGLPAMLLVIAMMWRAFSWAGDIIRRSSKEVVGDRFMLWCFGAGLFAHAATSLSASYFDQSMIFFWLNVAVISSMHSIVSEGSAAQPVITTGVQSRLVRDHLNRVARSPRSVNPVKNPWTARHPRGVRSPAVDPGRWS